MVDKRKEKMVAFAYDSRSAFIRASYRHYERFCRGAVYLYPFLMSFIEQKALRECKQGTKIVARDFPLPNLRYKDKWQTPSGHTLYLYLIN